MLCDELIEHLGSNKHESGRLYRVLDKKGCDAFVDELRAAHKFVLTEDTFHMARNLITGKPSSLLASIEYAKSPYPVTWVEYQTSFKTSGSKLDTVRTAPQAKRVGFLVKRVADKKYAICMGYSYRGQEAATINPLMWLFDASVFTEQDFRSIMNLGAAYWDKDALAAANEDPLHEHLRADTLWPTQHEELECAMKLERMFMPIGNPYLLNTMARTKAVLGDKVMALESNQWLADWQGETGIPIVVFILLNCRNAVQSIPCQSLQELNKARRLRGKAPLCEYHTLELQLTEDQKRAASESKDTDRQIRLHWRRGHFKHRKTGLFWWNPHLSGRKELGMVEKDYVA